MKNNKLILSGIFLLALSAQTVMGQDTNTDNHSIDIKIPQVALLDIETSASKTLNLEGKAPNEAGMPVDFSEAKNSDLWINYSSIIGAKTLPQRNVTAAVTKGTIPDGVQLKVTAAADAGKGGGKLGTTAGQITLSGTAQNIITAVGSSYTGNGANAGHNLTYVLELDAANYSKLDFDQSNTVEVTYTLTDN